MNIDSQTSLNSMISKDVINKKKNPFEKVFSTQSVNSFIKNENLDQFDIDLINSITFEELFDNRIDIQDYQMLNNDEKRLLNIYSRFIYLEMKKKVNIKNKLCNESANITNQKLLNENNLIELDSKIHKDQKIVNKNNTDEHLLSISNNTKSKDIINLCSSQKINEKDEILKEKVNDQIMLNHGELKMNITNCLINDNNQISVNKDENKVIPISKLDNTNELELTKSKNVNTLTDINNKNKLNELNSEIISNLDKGIKNRNSKHFNNKSAEKINEKIQKKIDEEKIVNVVNKTDITIDKKTNNQEEISKDLSSKDVNNFFDSANGKTLCSEQSIKDTIEEGEILIKDPNKIDKFDVNIKKELNCNDYNNNDTNFKDLIKEKDNISIVKIKKNEDEKENSSLTKESPKFETIFTNEQLNSPKSLATFNPSAFKKFVLPQDNSNPKCILNSQNNIIATNQIIEKPKNKEETQKKMQTVKDLFRNFHVNYKEILNYIDDDAKNNFINNIIKEYEINRKNSKSFQDEKILRGIPKYTTFRLIKGEYSNLMLVKNDSNITITYDYKLNSNSKN